MNAKVATTPIAMAMLIDEADFRARAHAFAAAFGPSSSALRGQGLPLHRRGALGRRGGPHLDVCTGGELAVARRAQFPAERIGFHGNNKTTDEIREALTTASAGSSSTPSTRSTGSPPWCGSSGVVAPVMVR